MVCSKVLSAFFLVGLLSAVLISFEAKSVAAQVADSDGFVDGTPTADFNTKETEDSVDAVLAKFLSFFSQFGDYSKGGAYESSKVFEVAQKLFDAGSPGQLSKLNDFMSNFSDQCTINPYIDNVISFCDTLLSQIPFGDDQLKSQLQEELNIFKDEHQKSVLKCAQQGAPASSTI